jgi:hypothetical protein
MIRVDLFTTVHKGVRSLLFEAAIAAARVDLGMSCEVDALNERVERMLGLIEEHAQHEDAEILPVLRNVDRALAASLAVEHLELEAAHHEVERAVRTLALAAPTERGVPGGELVRAMNRLTAGHLVHMEREETLANAVLWGAVGDAELVTIRTRILARVSDARHAEWRAILTPVVNSTERALVLGGGVRVD